MIRLSLHSRSLELDLEQKQLVLHDGDQRIALPRSEVAQMMSFLLMHPMFFEDLPVEVHPVSIVPCFADLLERGALKPGMSELMLGVQAESGEPFLISWEDFRSGAVGGRGRSGLTNTLAFLVVQALLGGVEVWIADPHFNRSTSLTALLRPLAHRIRLAGTAGEVEKMIHDWEEEMDRRKAEPSLHKPMLVVFDGWDSLLEPFDGDFSIALVASAIRCAREMAAYGMILLLGAQCFGNEKVGGAVLRRLLHIMLCHRMPADSSRHVFPRKQADQTEGLRTGRFILRDNEGCYSLLAAPFVSVEDMATIECLLGEAQ